MATGNNDNDNGDGNGIRQHRRQWLGTTGNKVDNYGQGAMGDNDNDDGDGTERRNNQDAHPYFRSM